MAPWLRSPCPSPSPSITTASPAALAARPLPVRRLRRPLSTSPPTLSLCAAAPAMGIPLGWNIVRDEAKEKDVLRADVAGSRSPIRRRARASRAARHLDVLDAYSHTPRFASVLEHAPRLEHARTQLLPPAPPVPELRDRDRDELPALTPGFAPAAARSPSRPSRYDEARLAAEHARERHLHPLSSPYDDDARPPAAHDGALPPQSLPPPRGSPSRALGGRRIQLGDSPPLPSRIPTSTTTTTTTWTASRRSSPYARPPRRDGRNPYVDVDVDADDSPREPSDSFPREANAVSHPPLRRVGHRRIADGPLPASSLRESWSPVSTVDGLGDRERSNSVSSTSSNLPWQTFLSTVVPDPVPPTAESSFASSAASASFAASSSRASSSNSNSTVSEHTHVTVPSRRPSPGLARRRGDEFRESFARACESSDEGESTASDTDDEATANPLSRRRIRPSYFADEPPSPRRYGRSVLDQGSDLRRYVREYVRSSFSAQPTSQGSIYQLDGLREPNGLGIIDGSAREAREQDVEAEAEAEAEAEVEAEADSFTTVVDDDAAQIATPASPLDQELRDARSLLERLTRRGDIGDDFWASVGLTRSFADGVERVQERGRF